MKLYLVSFGEEFAPRKKAFVNACNNMGVDLVNLNYLNYDQYVLKSSDLYYRATTGGAGFLDKILIAKFKPKNLYKNNLFIPISTIDANIVHTQNNIPIVKTSFVNLPDDQIIKKNVKYLGGFPVVIKRSNLSKGQGILIAKNLKELMDLVKTLTKNEENFILREYIDSPGVSYRSIVLGNKVLVTYRNQSVHTDDFRSNVDQTKRIRKVIKLSNKEEKIMVQAVNVLGIEFGAVDFAYDSLNNPKIFEVNFPCNFIPAQELSGVDIAKEIILYLKNK